MGDLIADAMPALRTLIVTYEDPADIPFTFISYFDVHEDPAVASTCEPA